MAKDISIQQVEQKIFLIRGEKVMLDSDLATLYKVTTGRLRVGAETRLHFQGAGAIV